MQKGELWKPEKAAVDYTDGELLDLIR